MLKPRIAQRMTLAMVVALALAGCAGGLGGARQPDLGSALLTLADVQQLPTAPGGLIDRPDQAVELTLTAKFGSQPEAVCGKPPVVTLPPPGDRAVAVLVSDPSALVVTHWVYRMEPRMAERYFGMEYAMLTDCPPTWTEGPYGPQAEVVVDEVPLPTIGDDRVARSSYFRIGNATAYGMVASVRSGAMMTTIAIGSPSEVSPAFLTDLAVAAARKLG